MIVCTHAHRYFFIAQSICTIVIYFITFMPLLHLGIRSDIEFRNSCDVIILIKMQLHILFRYEPSYEIAQSRSWESLSTHLYFFSLNFLLLVINKWNRFDQARTWSLKQSRKYRLFCLILTNKLAMDIWNSAFESFLAI